MGQIMCAEWKSRLDAPDNVGLSGIVNRMLQIMWS